MQVCVHARPARSPRIWLFTACRYASSHAGEKRTKGRRGGAEGYVYLKTIVGENGVEFQREKKESSNMYIEGVPIPLRTSPEEEKPANERNGPTITYGLDKGERFFPVGEDKLHENLRKKKSTSDDTRVKKRRGPYRDLPLPPLLQPPPNLKDRFKERHADRGFEGWSFMTKEEQDKLAPFSSMLQQNPYAIALATPVRSDAFTNARLPMSCLIDFHLCESPDGPSKTQLLPVSFASELVSKTMAPSKRTDAEDAAVSAWKSESTSAEPMGFASYVLNKEEAIQFISERPEKRVGAFAAGSRRLRTQDQKSLQWREDMPDFVLQNMRKVVAKKLGILLQKKGDRHKHGLVCAPFEDTLARLDEIEDVMCVVRTTRSSAGNNLSDVDTEILSHGLSESHIDAVAYETSPLFDEVEERVNGAKSEPANDSTTSGDDSSSFVVGQASPTPMKQTDPTATVKYSQTASLDLAGSDAAAAQVNVASMDDQLPANSTIQEATPDTNPSRILHASHPGLSTTYVRNTGPWSHSERRSFHADLLPVPPPIGRPQSATYFPTLPYRNRRVPLYSLPILMGDEMAANMIKDTAFEDGDWIVLCGSRGTVRAQMWLVKLAAYLGKERGEHERI